MRSISLGILTVLLLAAGISSDYTESRPKRAIEDFKAYYYDDDTQPGNGNVRVTFLGVSTLLIDDGETQLLIDGFFSRPPIWAILHKVSTNRKRVDTMITRFGLNRVKAIFVAHSHYDHAFDVAYVTQKTKAHLYGSQSTLDIGKGGCLKDEQMELYQIGKELQFGKFSVRVLPSKHSPATRFNNDIGQVIDEPLHQPAKIKAYVEGGSFDFVVKHKGHIIYIKPSANYIEGSLDSLKADVVFLGVGLLGKQCASFREKYYAETVGKLKPRTVIPVHWDNFFLPFSEELKIASKLGDDIPKSFEYLIEKTQKDHINFFILQGGKSFVLYDSNGSR